MRTRAPPRPALTSSTRPADTPVPCRIPIRRRSSKLDFRTSLRQDAESAGARGGTLRRRPRGDRGWMRGQTVNPRIHPRPPWEDGIPFSSNEPLSRRCVIRLEPLDANKRRRSPLGTPRRNHGAQREEARGCDWARRPVQRRERPDGWKPMTSRLEPLHERRLPVRHTCGDKRREGVRSEAPVRRGHHNPQRRGRWQRTIISEKSRWTFQHQRTLRAGIR